VAGFELCSHAPTALHSNAYLYIHTNAYAYTNANPDSDANATIRLPDLSLSAGSG
jgi:hypothetical protein